MMTSSICMILHKDYTREWERQLWPAGLLWCFIHQADDTADDTDVFHEWLKLVTHKLIATFLFLKWLLWQCVHMVRITWKGDFTARVTKLQLSYFAGKSIMRAITAIVVAKSVYSLYSWGLIPSFKHTNHVMSFEYLCVMTCDFIRYVVSKWWSASAPLLFVQLGQERKRPSKSIPVWQGPELPRTRMNSHLVCVCVIVPVKDGPHTCAQRILWSA